MKRNAACICNKGTKVQARNDTVFTPEALKKRRFRSHGPQNWSLLSRCGYRLCERPKKMETKIGESHPSDMEKSLWLHCIENHGEKATGNAGKSSREEEIFCKSTWAEKEPLRWRQGRTQIGAFWILGRQKKTRACKEPLGCQCQCWHLELKVLRIPTHTHSHWSVWWLRLSTAERAEQGRRTRGSQPALQEEQSQLDLGRDFHL